MYINYLLPKRYGLVPALDYEKNLWADLVNPLSPF
jgi:hypothetical protein